MFLPSTALLSMISKQRQRYAYNDTGNQEPYRGGYKDSMMQTALLVTTLSGTTYLFLTNSYPWFVESCCCGYSTAQQNLPRRHDEARQEA